MTSLGLVAVQMETYGRLIAHIQAHTRGPSPEAVVQLASAMIVQGKVHPFLDGNGHVQRLSFQLLAERAGYTTRGWRVHPRPYGEAMDRLMASADVRGLAVALGTYLRGADVSEVGHSIYRTVQITDA